MAIIKGEPGSMIYKDGKFYKFNAGGETVIPGCDKCGKEKCECVSVEEIKEEKVEEIKAPKKSKKTKK